MNYDSITIDEKQLNEFFMVNKDTLILAVSPSCNIYERKGNYRSALLYHGYKKTFTSELDNITSSNKCALHGMIDAALHIKACDNIILLVAGNFGFKKAIKYKGVNSELWNELFSILESKGCKLVTEVIVKNGGFQISVLCR